MHRGLLLPLRSTEMPGRGWHALASAQDCATSLQPSPASGDGAQRAAYPFAQQALSFGIKPTKFLRPGKIYAFYTPDADFATRFLCPDPHNSQL
ncbi:hypothetical protein DWU99_19145 [Dyella psychrodurans]|uniref:Uncharacterized protein n=1 Tax=Dyella psychrodurans TaxID=1927960 RepID=A0A370WX41_9GAMM|nr:hypothetical protein DWU99_19145 [Dyella psychrodurans]